MCCISLGLLAWLAIPLILVKLYLKFTTGWCTSKNKMTGKVVIITGANTGPFRLIHLMSLGIQISCVGPTNGSLSI